MVYDQHQDHLKNQIKSNHNNIDAMDLDVNIGYGVCWWA